MKVIKFILSQPRLSQPSKFIIQSVMDLRMARIAGQGTLSGLPCAVKHQSCQEALVAFAFHSAISDTFDSLFKVPHGTNQLRAGADKGNPTVQLRQSVAMASKGVDAMRYLPGAPNAKVMKFKCTFCKGGCSGNRV